MPLIVSRIARLVFSSCLARAEAPQRLDLQVVERVDVGAAVAEAARELRVVLQQLALPGDRQQVLDGPLRTRSGCGRRCGRAARRRRPARRSARRCGCRSSPAPCPCWTAGRGRTATRAYICLQQRPGPPRRGARRAARTAAPNPYQPGSMMRGQRPAEHPGNGAQVLDAIGLLARRRAAADVQIGDLGDRRGGAEVGDEPGRLVHELAVRREGVARTSPPSPRGRRSPRRATPPRSSSVASRVAATSVSRLRRPMSGSAYLLAITSPCSVMRICPLHAAGRLRQDRLVARAAAAPDRAAAAVEQAQLHAVPLEHLAPA